MTTPLSLWLWIGDDGAVLVGKPTPWGQPSPGYRALRYVLAPG